MNNTKNSVLMVFGAVAIFILLYFGFKNYLSTKPGTPNDSSRIGQANDNSTLHTFAPIGLSLRVPNDLNVEQSEPDPGNLFTAYIQNDATNTGNIDDSYQLYIMWQRTEKMSEDKFEIVRNELIPDSITVGKVDGKLAIKGQIKGERNRFATFVLHDGNKISFLTSQPTQKNLRLSDQIISTAKFSEIPDAPIQSYTCPESGWADCMPSPDGTEKCTEVEMAWYEANCPNFQGGAM